MRRRQLKKTASETENLKRLIILASGTGTLFSSIAQACKTSHLDAKVISLISNNSEASVLKKAEKENVHTKILDLKKFPSFSEWDEALCAYLKSKRPDLIVLAGFIKKIGPSVLSSFKNCIVNTHPALLPRHGGKGMYGLHVHRSVLNTGDKKTGISIHLVSSEYDTGPVLAQTEIPVSPNDNPESLQEKIKKVEAVFYISVLQKIFKGEIKL